MARGSGQHVHDDAWRRANLRRKRPSVTACHAGLALGISLCFAFPWSAGLVCHAGAAGPRPPRWRRHLEPHVGLSWSAAPAAPLPCFLALLFSWIIKGSFYLITHRRWGLGPSRGESNALRTPYRDYLLDFAAILVPSLPLFVSQTALLTFLEAMQADTQALGPPKPSKPQQKGIKN